METREEKADRDEVEAMPQKASEAKLPGELSAPGEKSDTWSDQEWRVAEYLLCQYGISPVQAARFALEALESTQDSRVAGESEARRLSRIVRIGCEGYALNNQSVSFRELVESVLRYKSYRRERTLKELSQYCRRMLRQDPSWELRMVRGIRTEDCHELICSTYSTLTMQRKARVILHGVFAYAVRKGWCGVNPVSAIELPPVCEKQIVALTIKQVRQLLLTSLQKEHLPCAPALGILLWAGIRPNELERLHWCNIRFADKVITIPATHSKTGGARQVTLYPALLHWLNRTAPYRLPDSPIVPLSWARRWLTLRRAAGFEKWKADVLRHTFASYHLKYYRNINELQIDMGHRSPDLLRTRYISLDNVTRKAAREFWHLSVSNLTDRAKRSPETLEK